MMARIVICSILLLYPIKVTAMQEVASDDSIISGVAESRQETKASASGKQRNGMGLAEIQEEARAKQIQEMHIRDQERARSNSRDGQPGCCAARMKKRSHSGQKDSDTRSEM